MNNFTRRGIIFVLSAPSGTGKSTLCNNLRQTPDFVYSVSCTTRPPRAGEEEGRDYYFLERKEFERKIANKDFLEYADVYGDYYGTLLSEALKPISEGRDVLLEIEVQGARLVRSHTNQEVRDALVDVFIMPPTLGELERRLRKRGTETEEQIQKRLKISAQEMLLWKDYKYTILSGSMEEDLTKFRAIMRAEHYLSRRLELQHV
ncbi:MAG: guanylate kinase [bacterium]